MSADRIAPGAHPYQLGTWSASCTLPGLPEEIEADAPRLNAHARGHQLAETHRQLGLAPKQIAGAMGVSVDRVSQLEHRASQMPGVPGARPSLPCRLCLNLRFIRTLDSIPACGSSTQLFVARVCSQGIRPCGPLLSRALTCSGVKAVSRMGGVWGADPTALLQRRRPMGCAEVPGCQKFCSNICL